MVSFVISGQNGAERQSEKRNGPQFVSIKLGHLSMDKISVRILRGKSHFESYSISEACLCNNFFYSRLITITSVEIDKLYQCSHSYTGSNTIFTMHDSAFAMLLIFEDSILITTPQMDHICASFTIYMFQYKCVHAVRIALYCLEASRKK